MAFFNVWHRIEPTFQPLTTADKLAFPRGFVLVATVEADRLEHVWHRTQNITGSWMNHPAVKATIRQAVGARSSSVGDVFVEAETGRRHGVLNIGFGEF